MLERSAGKLARSVLRGLGEREPTWLPGDSAPARVDGIPHGGKGGLGHVCPLDRNMVQNRQTTPFHQKRPRAIMWVWAELYSQ
jgi:hypothetical protein